MIHADREENNEEHRGRYNVPTTNEVAVVLVNQECDKRDIIVRARDHTLHRILLQIHIELMMLYSTL